MDPIAPLITALHASSRLRVWSLVITVFGDCVQHRGGRISTTRLQKVLGRIGVESGALRTALSRLGRDGWVESERTGRISHYRLSQSGIDRFTEATGRIYAPPRLDKVERWSLSLGGDPARGFMVGGLVLSPSETAKESNAALELRGSDLQIDSALRETLLSAEHIVSLEALFADLAAIDDAPLDPLDAVAARVLLIHRWRRIVLRFPEVPAEILPAAFGPIPPRVAVAQAYARLAEPSEAWLDLGDGDMEPMRRTDARFAKRFCP